MDPRRRRPSVSSWGARLCAAGAIAVAPLLGTVAGAQISEAEAVQGLRSETQAAQRAHREVVRGLRAAWLARFAAPERQLKQGYDAGAVGDIFLDLDTLVEDLYGAHLSALGDVQSGSFPLLFGLADGGGLDRFPIDFYMRSGGRLEKFYDAIEKDVHGALKGAERKLDRLTRKAGKRGTGFAAFLERYPELYEITVNETSSFTPGGHWLTLDVIVAASDLAQNGDGRILAGGFPGDAAGTGDVVVRVRRDLGNDVTSVVTPVGGRWRVAFTNLVEGNYQVSVQPDGHDVQVLWKTIGVR